MATCVGRISSRRGPKIRAFAALPKRSQMWLACTTYHQTPSYDLGIIWQLDVTSLLSHGSRCNLDGCLALSANIPCTPVLILIDKVFILITSQGIVLCRVSLLHAPLARLLRSRRECSQSPTISFPNDSPCAQPPSCSNTLLRVLTTRPQILHLAPLNQNIVISGQQDKGA